MEEVDGAIHTGRRILHLRCGRPALAMGMALGDSSGRCRYRFLGVVTSHEGGGNHPWDLQVLRDGNYSVASPGPLPTMWPRRCARVIVIFDDSKILLTPYRLTFKLWTIILMKTARIFISHSSQDKPFVRRLAKDLEALRLNVWIDEQELRVGDSIVSGISSGLSDSDYLILVLSRASVASRWVTAELNAALMGEFTRAGAVVLPALIEDCELPILLRDRVYADFRQDYRSGLGSISEVLSQEREPRHTRSLPADGCEEALRYLSAAELRRRLEKRLTRDELRVLWHATLNTDMEDDMRSSKLQICALELILSCQRRNLLSVLRSNACLDFPQIACT